FCRARRNWRRGGSSAQLRSAGHQIAYGGTFLSGRFARGVVPGCSLLCCCATRGGGGLASGLADVRRADGRVQELFEGIEQGLRKDLEVADSVPIGGEAEEDLTVV